MNIKAIVVDKLPSGCKNCQFGIYTKYSEELKGIIHCELSRIYGVKKDFCPLVEKEYIEVIKSALYSHIRQCKEFIALDDKVKTFTNEERKKLEEKISKMEQLLKED